MRISIFYHAFSLFSLLPWRNRKYSLYIPSSHFTSTVRAWFSETKTSLSLYDEVKVKCSMYKHFPQQVMVTYKWGSSPVVLSNHWFKQLVWNKWPHFVATIGRRFGDEWSSRNTCSRTLSQHMVQVEGAIF